MLNANGVKSITRSGTTFTVTRNDNTTFTFDQQDNNTTYGLSSTTAHGLLRQLNGNTANYMRGDGTWQTPPNTWKQNTNAQEGYVLKGVANKVWKCDANGTPAWRDDANTTYGLASTSANGLLRQLNGNTSSYMRGDGTWQTPPNTNTWRPVQNNVTSTSTTDCLSANMGKWLNEHKNPYVGNVVSTKKAVNVANMTDTNVQTVTLGPGTYILFMRFAFATNPNGRRHAEIAHQSGSSWLQNGHYDLPAVGNFNTCSCVTDVFTVAANTVFAARVWHDAGTTLTVETDISYIKLK